MRVEFGGHTGIITDTIGATMGNSISLFMWIIGNSAVDNRNQDFFVIVHDPSRSGKTSVINIIADMFSNCCSVLDSTKLTDDASIQYRDVLGFEGSRIATTNDISFENNCGINIGNIKRMTGNDAIRGTSGEAINLSITVIGSSNDLPIPVRPHLFVLPEVSRRFIVMRTLNRARGVGPNVHDLCMPDFSESDKAVFLAECIKVRLMYRDPPHNIGSMLDTLYLGNSPQLREVFITDTTLRAHIYIENTWYLASTTGVSYDTLIDTVSAMSKSMIGETMALYYIRDLGLVGNRNDLIVYPPPEF
jgi:hypothetical protein